MKRDDDNGLKENKKQARQIHRLHSLALQIENKPRWNLVSKKRNEEELTYLFRRVDPENQIKQILLQWNLLPGLPSMLKGRSFLQLKSLNLGSNNIISLESLPHANIPQLEALFLWNNKIISIAPLRKLQAYNLAVLDLSSNEITQVESIIALNCKKLELLNLENNLLGDINALIRMHSDRKNLKISIVHNNLVSIVGNSMREDRKKATYMCLFGRRGLVEYC